MELSLKTSKRVINFAIYFSIIINFGLLIWEIFFLQNAVILRIIFFLILFVYQARYWYLVNFLKKDKSTFQLLSKLKYPLLTDTLASVFLLGILPTLFATLHMWFHTKLDWMDWVAFAVYVIGTAITILSERQRRLWKKDNPNSVYKEGLFKYANHINYFGETLSFSGLCWLTTGFWWVFLGALSHQIIDFVFIQIPKQENYTKQKYPQEYEIIKKRKKLVPFVY